MFKSKPSAPQQPQTPWRMQVLTLDYLIEGNVEPTGEVSSLLMGGRQYYENRYHVILKPAHLQPTGGLATPALTVAQWTVQHRNGLVAVIPRDEAGTQELLKAAQGKTFTFRAVLYAGSYVIRASLSPVGMFGKPEMPGAVFEQFAFIPAQDAEIECQAPGAQMRKLAAPWLVLNTEVIQGYHPA